MITNYACIPMITKPTRVTRTSSTLLDHMYTNILDLRLTPSIINSDLTDHYPIFCLLETTTRFINSRYKRRDFGSMDYDSFTDDVFHVCSGLLFSSSGIEEKEPAGAQTSAAHATLPLATLMTWPPWVDGNQKVPLCPPPDRLRDRSTPT